MNKLYIDSNQLMVDSYQLAINIYESGWRPDFIVGVWRGGCPVGIAVQEVFEYLGVSTDHIAIRTSSYAGIGERSRSVRVHGLNYLVERLQKDQSVLIVDDIHDTGLSIDQTINELRAHCGEKNIAIKIATPYYKPDNNQTTRVPDYFLHSTDQWVVFPHELAGLTDDEIIEHKPGIDKVKLHLLALKKNSATQLIKSAQS